MRPNPAVLIGDFESANLPVSFQARPSHAMHRNDLVISARSPAFVLTENLGAVGPFWLWYPKPELVDQFGWGCEEQMPFANEPFGEPTSDNGFELPHHTIRLITAALFIASLIAAGATFAVTPSVPDLYHLINFNERPRKPEGTFTYLFGFPTLLGVATGLMYLNRNERLPSYKSAWARLGVVCFVTVWLGMFFFSSILRDVAAYNFYHP